MSNQNNQDQAPSIDETNDLIAQRQAKLDEITASGKIAYPNKFKRTDYAEDLQKQFEGISKEEIEEKAAS